MDRWEHQNLLAELEAARLNRNELQRLLDAAQTDGHKHWASLNGLLMDAYIKDLERRVGETNG